MSAPARLPWVVIRPRWLPLSLRVDRRVPLVALALVLGTLALMIVNIGVGEYPISPLDVIKTALGVETGNADHRFVVMTLRLPRMLVAALVGMALGTAGAIMQGLTRNPLASPDIIGINAGAGVVAVTLIVLLPNAPAAVLPAAAFGGALAVAALTYLLAWRRGDSPLRLVLIGIGLNAVLGALTTLQITFGNINQVSRALVWLTGSVYGRSWADLQAMLPWVVVGVPLALLLARDLNALNLGEEVARGLGSRVAVQRGLALLTVVGLAGASVAAAGTIGFVALMSPHIARRLVGPIHEGALPVAALTGAAVLVGADLVGRTLLAPIELPAGLVTAAIGAPFFLILLARGRAR
jgi:iron complex transport system permease protein